MTFYEELAETAVELLTEFGTEVTVQAESGTLHEARGVMITAEREQPTDIQQHPGGIYTTTKTCLLSPELAHSPQVNERLIHADKTYLITEVHREQPTDVLLYYQLSLGQ